MIRVVLPGHLRNLAQTGAELSVDAPDGTVAAVLDAIETSYPVLRGTIRDHTTQTRRPYVRFFACQQDLSHEPADMVLPEPVLSGTEPFVIIGAIAGGS